MPLCVASRIVVSLNKSTHQARLGFQVPGLACGHASPQKLKVHDRLLLFLQRETPARTRAGGQTPWATGALFPVWAHTVPAPPPSGARPVSRPFLAQCGRTFVAAQDALCRARHACTFERSCAPAFNLAENSVASGGDRRWLLHRARIRPLGAAAWLRKYEVQRTPIHVRSAISERAPQWPCWTVSTSGSEVPRTAR